MPGSLAKCRRKWLTASSRGDRPRQSRDPRSLRISEIAAHIRFCAGEDGDALDTGESAIVVEVRSDEGPPGGEEGAGDPPEEDAIEDGVIDGEDLDPETAEAIESLEPGRSQKKRKHRR
jgi:hypothetical protein